MSLFQVLPKPGRLRYGIPYCEEVITSSALYLRPHLHPTISVRRNSVLLGLCSLVDRLYACVLLTTSNHSQSLSATELGAKKRILAFT